MYVCMCVYVCIVTVMVELRDILVKSETPREDVDTDHLKSYMRYIKKGELSVLDGVIFYGNRILIPGSQRQEVSESDETETGK